MARLSGIGVGALVVAALAAGAGWWLGWAELASLGAAALLLLAVCLLTTVGRSRFTVLLDLADRRVRVGERAFGRLVVRNAAARRSRPVQAELPVGADAVSLTVPRLRPGQEHDELFAVPTSRRAVVVVGPVRTVRADPLGIARRWSTWTEPVELFVHPRLVPLAGADAGLLRDLEGQATRDLSDTDLSFHALRDYVTGDDRRSIHWRTTARRGVLTVKQYEDTRRTLTALVLATDSRDYVPDAEGTEFELAVSVLASIGVQVLGEQRELVALAGPGRLRSRTRPTLLDDCSALQTALGGTTTADLGRRVAREAAAATVAVLVTGSAVPPEELRAAARHVPAGTRTVAVRCVPGESVEVRTRGSLSLVRLGALDDLPRALRQVVS